MLKKIIHYGFVLTDEIGMPRYWAIVWCLLIGGSLAESTLKKQLSNIEAFYLHSEFDRPFGFLDDALGRMDLPVLEELLESYFVALRNVPVVGPSAALRWHHAVAFTREISERLSRTPDLSERFADVRIRLDRLDRMYGQLRITKKTKTHFVRALPASVMSELYDAVLPGSPSNPFKSAAAQWRAYAAFLLLFHQGLRRGEVLSLPADFLKSENTDTGRKFWLNVRTNNYEDDDPRHSTPSIKSVASIRQIPISPATAAALFTYIENYRGRQNHSFFLSSAKNRPLSAEGLNYVFKVLSASMSTDTMRILNDRTGMTSISPHDLRHTAAVVRLKQLLVTGDPMWEALQKLRSFFGWTADSSMPLLYAKAAFEERLSKVWSDNFDNRAAMLMELPQ